MVDYLLPFQPSLAQATNTRLDSACKHIQQCRVATDDMLRFVREDAEELQRNKYRYCVHKDELVVGVGRPWDPRVVIKRVANNAYPRVISNLGALMDTEDGRIAINMIRFMNHYARSIEERGLIIKFFKDNKFVPSRRFVNNVARLSPGCEAFKDLGDSKGINTAPFMSMMNDYFGVGYANTLGYAHANSGDTMTSVMIGGLRTVMNGDFEIFPGDLVQFYWSFEKDDFLPNGRRKPYVNIWDGTTPCNIDPSIMFDIQLAGSKRDSTGREVWPLPQDAIIRRDNFNLSYGQRSDKQKIVAKIKPFFRDEESPRLMDWFRVFGVAIASARPNEMCDIKISRQSL